MADDWQPGNLALCVRPTGHPDVRPGGVFTVSRLLWDRGINIGGWHQGFTLEGVKNRPGVTGFAAFLFRKIRPHTPDEEDRETIRLLNGVPVGEPA